MLRKFEKNHHHLLRITTFLRHSTGHMTTRDQPETLQATPDNMAHLFLGYNSTLGCAKSKSKGNFEKLWYSM